MKDKEIKITKIFHELHGEKARLSNLILVYTVGIISALIFTIILLPLKLSIWKYILVAVLVLDISSGVVANLSTPTNQYYQKNSRLRLIFLSLHILQPLLFIVIFPELLLFFLFVFLYTISASLIVNWIKDKEYQQNIASAFVVLGTILSFVFKNDILIVYAIAPLFMTKLILGFAVRRPIF
ncbi:MAG TPA: hypothetical protein PK239_11910 [Chitinophagales bacterium]|nr:hypothetical protein [Chitinophagales bacterium]